MVCTIFFTTSPSPSPDDSDDIKSLSIWLIVDLTDESGITVLKEAVEYLVSIAISATGHVYIDGLLCLH